MTGEDTIVALPPNATKPVVDLVAAESLAAFSSKPALAFEEFGFGLGLGLELCVWCSTVIHAGGGAKHWNP